MVEPASAVHGNRLFGFRRMGKLDHAGVRTRVRVRRFVGKEPKVINPACDNQQRSEQMYEPLCPLFQYVFARIARQPEPVEHLGVQPVGASVAAKPL